MSNFNKVFLEGRLVRNAETKTTADGLFIANFTIATNISKPNKDGKWEDVPHFFNHTLYGNRAKALSPYLIQGQLVLIEGHLIQRRWEKDGKKYSRQETAIDNIELVSRPKNASSANEEATLKPLDSSVFANQPDEMPKQEEFSEPEFSGDVF